MLSDSLLHRFAASVVVIFSGIMAWNQSAFPVKNPADKPVESRTGSGSVKTVILVNTAENMRDVIGKREKIRVIDSQLARYGSLIKKLPMFISVYGRKPGAQCRTPALIDRFRLSQYERHREAIRGIVPAGRISAARLLMHAVENNANRQTLTSFIYLFADQDVCVQKVCDAVIRLQQQGYRFRVNVISLAVPVERQRQIQCVARETDGMFLNIKTAREFGRAFRNLVYYIRHSEKTTALAPVKIEAPVAVVAGSKFSLRWRGKGNAWDRVVISSPDGKFVYGSYYINSNGKAGSHQRQLSITAPVKPGDYLLRYINGTRNTGIASRVVKVKGMTAKLLPVAPVVSGSEFHVRWQGPNQRYDQVRIVSPADRAASWSYVFTRMCKGGIARLVAPEKAGNYELHYIHNDRVLARVPLAVKPAMARLELPSRIMAGSRIEVKWSGPMNAFDRIRLVRADGNKVKGAVYVAVHRQRIVDLPGPLKTGEYYVEYVTTGKKVLARRKITVVAARASLSKIEPAVAGSRALIKWRGPINEYDQIAIIKPGKPDHKLGFTYAKFHKTRYTYMTVPEQAGRYEVIYLSESNRVLARTGLVVKPARAKIQPIGRHVERGRYFQVNWQGPNNYNDRIMIRSLNGGRSHNGYVYPKLYKRQRAHMLAPRRAGEYAIEYRTGKNRVLARTRLIVK